MTEFTGVIPVLGKALTKRGYASLTPIQKAVLAPEIGSADLLVSAQTGSGKTVAFGLALAPTLLGEAESFGKVKKPLALVIAPTRELALQVARELEWLYEISGAKVISCVGGMDARAEKRALEHGPHIVVGTPGRLCDHIKRGYFDTSELKAVVLDEADEMLDMGFRDELEYILNTAPKTRRTLMFSATVPSSIATLAKRYQSDAKRITTKEEEKQHIDITHKAILVAPNDSENSIINILRYHDPKNAIIFCATRVAVNHMTSRFTNRGFSVVALSGELSQNERSHALQALRDGRAQVCIATDVASRGIDLPDLELVIHSDMPKNKELMLHRSGRTGRAGRKGVSVLIVPHNWRRRAEQLLQSAKITATWGKPPSIDDILQRDRERFLSDPALSEPVKEDERAFVTELLTRHGAERVAAALIRMQNKQKPAPEELLDAAPYSERQGSERQRPDRQRPDRQRPDRQNQEGPQTRHEDFKKGVWISLSIGRDASAEPRWLLPMLCGAGNLTKRQIGSIKIHQNETHVELAPDCVDSFLAAIGPSRKVEKNIQVTLLNGIPEEPKGNGDTKRKTHHSGKKPYAGKPRANSSPDAKRKFKKKPA